MTDVEVVLTVEHVSDPGAQVLRVVDDDHAERVGQERHAGLLG